ncbi:hypothetical protein Tco_0381943 [Tanacetum coccineum]
MNNKLEFHGPQEGSRNGYDQLYGGEGDGVSNWDIKWLIEDEKVSLVDGVLEDALGALVEVAGREWIEKGMNLISFPVVTKCVVIWAKIAILDGLSFKDEFMVCSEVKAVVVFVVE